MKNWLSFFVAFTFCSTTVAHELIIPKISLRVEVGTGSYLEELETIVALWSWTVEPGRLGNTVIGGHRTDGPAHFIDLDSLAEGDQIYLMWSGKLFEYKVSSKFVLTRPHKPNLVDREVSYVDELTLVTCHPKYSKTERLVIRAILVKPGER